MRNPRYHHNLLLLLRCRVFHRQCVACKRGTVVRGAALAAAFASKCGASRVLRSAPAGNGFLPVLYFFSCSSARENSVLRLFSVRQGAIFPSVFFESRRAAPRRPMEKQEGPRCEHSTPQTEER